jgi:hypothetical protein
VYHTYSVIFDEPEHGDIWIEAFKAKFEGGLLFQDWNVCLEITLYRAPIYFEDDILTSTRP